MTYFTITRTCKIALAALPLLLAGSAQAASYSDKPAKRLHAPAAAKVAYRATTPTPAPVAKKTATSKTAPTTPLLALVAAPTAALPATPAAVETVEVRGLVFNTDGRPCAGASVYPAGSPRQLVVTDAQGAFVLPVPAGAAVSLRVEYFGEGSSRVEVPTPSIEPVRITLGQ